MVNKNYASEFHEKYGVPIRDIPTPLTIDRQHLRVDLIMEELRELETAFEQKDLHEILDALCDLRVVVDGAVLECGLHNIYTEALEEVNRSNMSKLEDGKPLLRGDGKVLKGKDFTPPDFSKLLGFGK